MSYFKVGITCEVVVSAQAHNTTLSKIIHLAYHRSGSYRRTQRRRAMSWITPIQSALVITDESHQMAWTCQVSMRELELLLLNSKINVFWGPYGLLTHCYLWVQISLVSKAFAHCRLIAFLPLPFQGRQQPAAINCIILANLSS